MSKRYSIVCFVLLLIATACKSGSSKLGLMDAVPMETAVLLEVDNLDEFVKTAKAKSYVEELKAVVHAEGISAAMAAIDTLFGQESNMLSAPAAYALLAGMMA